MQKRLKDAVEIIRREPVFDEKGTQVGERVVATFAPYKDSSVVWAELLWTEGSRYVSQRRSSLQSILEDLDSRRLIVTGIGRNLTSACRRLDSVF